MMSAPDQVIPYSALTFTDIHSAKGPAGVTGYDAIGALLLSVVRRHAAALAGAPVHPVSWSMDVIGPCEGGALQLDSQLDRQTRTLIFINGTAQAGGALCLRVTALYRIEAT